MPPSGAVTQCATMQSSSDLLSALACVVAILWHLLRHDVLPAGHALVHAIRSMQPMSIVGPSCPPVAMSTTARSWGPSSGPLLAGVLPQPANARVAVRARNELRIFKPPKVLVPS